jgi:hypothetical protein
VWRVIGEGRAESRFEALHGAHVTPLVGRGEELDLMLSRWRLAKARSGQVVLIFGEPGIGKSRLVPRCANGTAEPIAFPLRLFAATPEQLALSIHLAAERRRNSHARCPARAPKAPRNALCGTTRACLTMHFRLADLLGVPSATSRTAGHLSAATKHSVPTFLARLDRLGAVRC